ncbi:hypothetical protein LO762_23015 [Actinocorallia sp. API 0066]|uniref:hypothetical protein n=1 Tax=Actinocorallia sp. API 0066 TaxID=2896846 RepID=UPI001E3AEFEA|nr:hypothetical protein [Actinocorallia sp. API 0066]MCD0452040.1 hypothetical protein [Actinocorallia sp. API 0066]
MALQIRMVCAVALLALTCGGCPAFRSQADDVVRNVDPPSAPKPPKPPNPEDATKATCAVLSLRTPTGMRCFVNGYRVRDERAVCAYEGASLGPQVHAECARRGHVW